MPVRLHTRRQRSYLRLYAQIREHSHFVGLHGLKLVEKGRERTCTRAQALPGEHGRQWEHKDSLEVRQLDVEPRTGNQLTIQEMTNAASPDIAALIGSLPFLSRQ